MSRFFINKAQINGTEATILGGDAYHIARSLRMAVGDTVTLSDGEGTSYSAVLTKIRDDECTAEIKETLTVSGESPVHITLYMAYPKGDKLETVVQKSVELGASEIIPFESSRCIKRPTGDKLEKITARLSRIAEEAAKQCGRSIVPSIGTVKKMKELLPDIGSYDLALLCYEGESSLTVKAALDGYEKADGRIAVIVGSEGGFSPEEARALCEAGAVSVSLGPRILRCETAPDYCLSVISSRFEL